MSPLSAVESLPIWAPGVRWAGDAAIAGETQLNVEHLARLTADFARTGQGLQSDADRVQTELALRGNDVVRADERVSLASARLAEAISLDAAYRIVPVEMGIAPMLLVSKRTLMTPLAPICFARSIMRSNASRRARVINV